ncbi:MAG: PhoH family protein [Candidatus Omnitrophica bacterium]|nr:PhoH family protein [Candidatus Omnitrophota bacterium]MBU1996204.1 PhoH family protein [Candidatus Omnitrophota bacterium]MBU4333557.1 PhoH family protein [Candidatus Omnitrophota bacterium]
MEKNFVLDTNVLIHNPQSIYSFADNIVIIPITVIEELDGFKSSADKKGMHARQVLREIDSLIKKGALKKGAKMINGGTLIIYVNVKDLGLPLDLDTELNDNRILGVAWKLQVEGNKVYFVSKDVNARIKAEAIGISAVDYENQKVEYGKLYRGWKELSVSRHDVTKLQKGVPLVVPENSFLSNEYALVKAEDEPGYDSIGKYSDDEKSIVAVDQKCCAMGISPLNVEQRFAFDLLLDDRIKLVALVGQAGTGKTLMAIAAALSKIIGEYMVYEKLLIVRPIVPLGKDIGYLPGSKEKKLNYWMQPIFDNLEFIMKRSLSSKTKGVATSELTVDSMMKSDIIEVEALTYIRGRSIPNQFLIVDEAQNLTPHEIKTVISRAGEGTKIVLTGDPDQIDNPYLDANSNGLSYTVDRLKAYSIFGSMLLSKSERSELASVAVEAL